ncbi:MAG: hypothetical protein AB7V50_11440 [Vampirovibrionia bacterium]
MNYNTNKNTLTKDRLEDLYKSNNLPLAGNYSLEKISNSINNSHLVIDLTDNEKLAGYCTIISDGIFYGRIQEIILKPEYKENTQIIIDLLLFVYENLPLLKTLHLNPAVIEKKSIYLLKHSAPLPKIKKLFWSIHEDEF